MAETYNHTISGLLRKRAELMGKAQALREELAVVGNDIDALDRVLVALGYEGDLDGIRAKPNRLVYFHRNELKRFLMAELRDASQPLTSRDLAEKIITLEGKDPRDRALRREMVRRVGKSLKLLRSNGVAESYRDEGGDMMWRLSKSLTATLAYAASV